MSRVKQLENKTCFSSILFFNCCLQPQLPNGFRVCACQSQTLTLPEQVFTENYRALFSWSSVVCSFLQNCEDRVTHLFYFQLIQSIQANYGHGTNEHPNLDLLNRFQVCDACLVLKGPSYLCFMLQFFWQDRTKTWLVWAVKT